MGFSWIFHYEIIPFWGYPHIYGSIYINNRSKAYETSWFPLVPIGSHESDDDFLGLSVCVSHLHSIAVVPRQWIHHPVSHPHHAQRCAKLMETTGCLRGLGTICRKHSGLLGMMKPTSSHSASFFFPDFSVVLVSLQCFPSPLTGPRTLHIQFQI